MDFKSKFQHHYLAEIQLSPPMIQGSSLHWLELDRTGELGWLQQIMGARCFMVINSVYAVDRKKK